MPTPALPTRLLAEVIGTFGFFFLGFSGIAASVNLPGSISAGGVALGFGLGLMMMIYALGHICGGHFNPAVSLGLAVGRRFPFAEVGPYWVAQIIGGILATIAARLCYTNVGTVIVNAPGKGISDGQAFAVELIATFLFLLVVHTVVSDDGAAWKGVHAPIAIGGFIFVAAVVIGPFSSGSFNPSRSLAPALVDGHWSHLWLYIVGPLVGAALAGVVSAFIRANEPGSTHQSNEPSDIRTA